MESTCAGSCRGDGRREKETREGAEERWTSPASSKRRHQRTWLEGEAERERSVSSAEERRPMRMDQAS